MCCISMGSTTKTEKGITLPISLLKQIENKRGDIPRSTFIRTAVESYLKGSKKIASNKRKLSA
jgi:metal-responsive CopG/Arc/MetJ family transcriptional regulator